MLCCNNLMCVVAIAAMTVIPSLGVAGEQHPEIISQFEKKPDGEDEAIKNLLLGISAQQKKTAPSKRGQHPKGHGCVKAVFHVRSDLPNELKFGLFKRPLAYTAYIRFSNGSEQNDRTPEMSHGMAIKVLGVHGEKILSTQRLWTESP